MIEVNEQLAEVISNSRVAFINGQMAGCGFSDETDEKVKLHWHTLK